MPRDVRAVPIIPDYLEELDNASRAAALQDTTDSPLSAAALAPTTDAADDGVPDVTPIAPEDNCKKQGGENILVGVMFASKAFVQLLTNPFIGPLTNRYE